MEVLTRFCVHIPQLTTAEMSTWVLKPQIYFLRETGSLAQSCWIASRCGWCPSGLRTLGGTMPASPSPRWLPAFLGLRPPHCHLCLRGPSPLSSLSLWHSSTSPSPGLSPWHVGLSVMIKDNLFFPIFVSNSILQGLFLPTLWPTGRCWMDNLGQILSGNQLISIGFLNYNFFSLIFFQFNIFICIFLFF